MKRTALEITSHSFPVVRRGFDPDAVRAYLAMLAEEAEAAGPPADEDGAASPSAEALAQVRAEAEAESTARVEAAEAAARQAQARIDELERALGAATFDRSEDDHRTRWQDTGEAVRRVLEAADAEARGLVEGAEALAIQIRQQVEAEVSTVRAEAARDAESVRAQARSEAVALVAEAEVERHGAKVAADEARAEGERLEAERTVRMAAAVAEAKAGVRTHIDDELASAGERIEALRAQEAEVSTRLQLVRDLVAESLGAAGAGRRPDEALSPATILEAVGEGTDLLAPTTFAGLRTSPDGPTDEGGGGGTAAVGDPDAPGAPRDRRFRLA